MTDSTSSSVNIGDVDGGIHGSNIAGHDINIHYHSASPPHRLPPSSADLEAAARQLAALPLDTIPVPAPLSPGSKMPYLPNPLFVGREDDLRVLAHSLKTENATAAIGQIAAATGLGGIGKSQLAVEFAHRYGQYFAGGVFWLSLADPASVPAEIAICGGPGGLNLYSDASGLKLDEQVALVLAAWQQPLPRLLIFDNCEEEALLVQWRPKSGGCRVLITSRRATWDATLGVTVRPLGVLNRDESVALLLKFLEPLTADCRPPTAEILNAIAAELGDLPLALHLAGSFLRRYRHSVDPETYLVQLGNKTLLDHLSMQGRGTTTSPTGHELHVARSFALSYARLNSTDPVDALALELLARAACFAPGEPIPRKLLLQTLAITDDETGLQAEDALRRLVELGLLEEAEDGALTLHRLLAQFVQGASDAIKAQMAVEETLVTEASRINDTGYPAALLVWQSHLRFVSDTAQARVDNQAARLCNRLGYHFNMIGGYKNAKLYYEKALNLYKTVFGPEHPDTANSLSNLGNVLREMGEYKSAQPYLEQALAIKEKLFGLDHLNTASTLNNLAALFENQGDYIKARSYYERALVLQRNVEHG